MDVSISSELNIDTSQGYLHRLEDYDTLASLAHLDTSERVIFLGAINLPPTHIARADAESVTMNGSTIKRRYPVRTFFAT